MIINQDDGLVVPDKTIVFFPANPKDGIKPFNAKDISLFLKPLNITHKRDWFKPYFYKCLALSIGNMQGFAFSLPYGFDIIWNGGNEPEDITITYHDDFKPYADLNFIQPRSDFGSGILTIIYPLTFKTPPNINLMTIAPPNFPTPGLSPMTGVVESDNLRYFFSLNLKIDLVNILIRVLPNTPIVGLIPIPRYFCDSFELKSAYDIFDKKVVDEEMRVVKHHFDNRTYLNENKLGYDRTYFSGSDIENNKFKNHQLPKNKLAFES